MFRCLCLLSIGAALLKCADATMDPVAWHSSPLPNVAATGMNEFHFWPDGSLNPRILVGGGASNFKISAGSPPVWPDGAAGTLDLPGTGLFLPDPFNPFFGGFLIGVRDGGGGKLLQAARFAGTVAMPVESADPNPGAVVGAISATYDPQGNLHVAYAWDGDPAKGNGNNSDHLGYARRSATTGVWNYTSRPVPIRPHATAIEANSFDSARIFFASGDATAAALSVATVVKYVNNLPVIQTVSGLDTPLTPDSSIKLLKGGGGNLLFYAKIGASAANITMRQGPNYLVATTLRSEPAVSGQAPVPRGIDAAFGIDGRFRVVWYDARHGRIHYLRPSGSGNGLPMISGIPVTTAANLPEADVRGLYFNMLGKPFVLYRLAGNAGRIAFLKDGYDLDRNGRDDLIDHAFGSSRGGVEILPLGPAAAGVANSANRLKLAFPGFSTATADASGGLVSAASNLRYKIDVSDNLSVWTTLSGGVNFTRLAAVPGSATHHRWVAVVAEPAPGGTPKRFARLRIDRPEPGY